MKRCLFWQSWQVIIFVVLAELYANWCRKCVVSNSPGSGSVMITFSTVKRIVIEGKYVLVNGESWT